MHLFVARFSDILDVVITCDGCDITLSGRRYRCLNCMDVDLCNNCYMCKYKFYVESVTRYREKRVISKNKHELKSPGKLLSRGKVTR